MIYSGNIHEKRWFSIVFCMFTRGYLPSNVGNILQLSNVLRFALPIPKTSSTWYHHHFTETDIEEYKISVPATDGPVIFFFYWSIQSISLCSWILSRFNPDLGNLHIERCRRIPCKHQPTGVLNTTHLISTHAHMEVSEVKGDPYFSSIFEKVGLSTIHHTAIGVALWRKPPVFLTFLWVYCHV